MAYPSDKIAEQIWTRDARKKSQSKAERASDDEKTADSEPAEELTLSKDIEDLPSIDHAAEAKLIRKLDFMIIPPVMLLYLFSFLDRVNIGNAKLYNMEKDLGLKGDQYQTAVSLLFVTYILCELPSNLVVKKLRPSRWIAFLTTSWGIVATLTGIVQSYGGLIAVRLILGALEAGLFPGLNIYLTLFYTKRELALRVGYLFVSAALAGSVGGLLAYGIGHMDGVAGESGWRWIMIIEGLPTVVLGISVYWWLADDPETAYYLTEHERHLMMVRKQRQIGYSPTGDHLHKEDVYKALKDWKVWVFAAGQFGVDTMLYGYSTFLPTIIKGLGSWSTAEVQALTVPCYALGAITYLIVAHFSDKFQQRGLAIIPFAVISIIGYAILISDVGFGAHYFACFLVACGLYVSVGIPLAWLPSNQPRYGKRTTASGVQLTIGNASGIMAPFLYKTDEAPRYIRGHAVSLSMVAMAAILYALVSVYLWVLPVQYRSRDAESLFGYSISETLAVSAALPASLKYSVLAVLTEASIGRNKARRDGKEDNAISAKSEIEIAEMGDENPRFHFSY